MSPFQFPDPNVATQVVNPDTGETWVYVNGVWEVQQEQEEETHSHEHTHQETDLNLSNINNQLASLTTAVSLLQTSIIEMNSRVTTLEDDTVLIIE